MLHSVKSMQRKKLRVIVRPWQPRNVPYTISQTQLKAFVQIHSNEFAEVVYLGWARRVEEEKRVIKFLISTGSTRLDAKRKFKEGQVNNIDLWEVLPGASTPLVDQVESGPE
jgi:hypothetical protein